MTAKRFLYRKLCCLWCRGKLLTYPKWSTAHLLGMPVPRPVSEARRAFVTRLFEQLRFRSLRPLFQRVDDAVAVELDRVFLELLGSTDAEAADWRERLAVEPMLQARARRRR